MKSSKIIAFAVAILALAWIASGLLRGGAAPPAQEMSGTPAQTVEQSPPDVRVRDSQAQEYSDDIEVTGRSRASRSVQMKAETSGQIQVLAKEEGNTVTTGEVLVELEIRDRDARVREARGRLNQRQIEYNASKKLEDKGFNSKVRLAQALADLEDAKAALKEAEVDQTKTKITAPFEGMLADQHAEIGDYLAVGDILFNIVDLDPIEFVGYVSERRIADIELGKDARAEFLDGTPVNGKVSYIAPAADPQTRTFRIVVTADNPDLRIREGLTAKIKIPVADKKAHKISPSILSLNDAGQIGVKIVDDTGKVKFMPVAILADEPKAMWITGLPDKALIITVGQDFVTDGQSVNPVPSDGDGLL